MRFAFRNKFILFVFIPLNQYKVKHQHFQFIHIVIDQ